MQYGGLPDQTAPIFRFLPPDAKYNYWHYCNFGKDSKPIVVIPGQNGSFVVADLLFGQSSGGNPEFETFAGSIYSIIPSPASESGEQDAFIHEFRFTAPDGHSPSPDGDTPTSLIRDGTGKLYGATAEGGSAGGGTVFRLSNPKPGQASVRVLHAFGGAQGSSPILSFLGPDGALYGTTPPSADNTIAASVWRLGPIVPGGWPPNVYSVLHRFVESPGATLSPLILGPDGSIYGTVGAGTRAAPGGPTLFKLTSSSHATSWTYKIAYQFPVPSNAVAIPSFAASDGTIYASTSYYGPHFYWFETPPVCTGTLCGAVWQVKPPQAPSSVWTSSVLYKFPNAAAYSGSDTTLDFVRLGFLRDATGLALYGTTSYATLIRITEREWK